MKIIAAALLLFVSLTTSLFAQSKRTIPYPILFVHGWTGSDSTWYKEIDYLKKQGLTIDIDNNRHRAAVGSRIDFDLNADGLNGSSVLIRNGKAPNYGDVQDLQSIVDPNNDVFVINFDNGTLSNQASATKQGFAVGLAVKKILQATGAEKIILFGHSMGGLAIREYLQNRENWLHDTSTHSVAKLITSGTPHLGSNISSLINISIFWGKDENSEAVRDLRTNISGSFLNGGYEGTIPNNFKNKDINSNGIEKDLITGLNQKPIYTNLHYANIIGIGGGSWLGYAGSQDDDVVLAENANLFNIYPGITGEVYYKHNDQQELGDKTELTWHTKLVKQTKLNDQALDVPSEFNLAYGIKLNREYKGNFTQNADLKSIDLDRYKFENTDRGILTLAANVPDKSNVVLSNYEGLPMHDFSTKATVRLEAMSSYFLSVYGEAKEGFTFPYTFSTSFCPLPKYPVIANKDTTLCEGNRIALAMVENGTYSDYQWYRDGELIGTTATIWADKTGTYTLTGTKCGVTENATNSVTITIKPSPAKPVITPTAAGLTTSAVTGNQWILNGVPLLGENKPTLTQTQAGTYNVEVKENGCVAMSDAFAVTGLEDQELNTTVYPNPSSGNFEVKTDIPGKLNFVLTDLQGRTIETYHKKDIETDQVPGLYLLRIEGKNRQVTKKILIK